MGLNGQFNARIQRLEKIVEDMPSGREVPQPSVADYGKVIGVDENGEYSLENVPKELPATTEIDAGKVVKVNASGTGYELGEGGESGLPDFTLGDAGKVLTVDYGVTTTPTIAVPEQTVVADGMHPVLLSNCLPDCFVPGFEISLVVNNQEYSATISAFGSVVVVIILDFIVIFKDNDGNVYFNSESGSYTVEATINVKDAEAVWKKPREYEDYKVEISISDYTSEASFYDALEAYKRGCNVYFTFGATNIIDAVAYYNEGKFCGDCVLFNTSSPLQVSVFKISFGSDGLFVSRYNYPTSVQVSQ